MSVSDCKEGAHEIGDTPEEKAREVNSTAKMLTDPSRMWRRAEWRGEDSARLTESEERVREEDVTMSEDTLCALREEEWMETEKPSRTSVPWLSMHPPSYSTEVSSGSAPSTLRFFPSARVHCDCDCDCDCCSRECEECCRSGEWVKWVFIICYCVILILGAIK